MTEKWFNLQASLSLAYESDVIYGTYIPSSAYRVNDLNTVLGI